MTAYPPLPLTYRRDRAGECWHLVPPGERGPKGRTLCGEPRQGTRLSEDYAVTRPDAPDCICQRCSDVASAQASSPGTDTATLYEIEQPRQTR